MLLRSRPVAFLLFAIAALTVASAWMFQIIGGYTPCELCLEQRVPYYAAIPLALLTFLLAERLRHHIMLTVFFILLGCIFAYGGGLGVYQAGAEWDFWYGPASCGGGADMKFDASNLFSQMKEEKLISCTAPQGRFLGLSFAGWNVLASGGLMLLAFFGAFNSKKHRTT